MPRDVFKSCVPPLQVWSGGIRGSVYRALDGGFFDTSALLPAYPAGAGTGRSVILRLHDLRLVAVNRADSITELQAWMGTPT